LSRWPQSCGGHYDDDVLVEAEVLGTQKLRCWLLSFGEYVEVVSPKALRKDFVEMTRNMASYYEE
jgi:predicted DNA-binding transcriptional regulator YafY